MRKRIWIAAAAAFVMSLASCERAEQDATEAQAPTEAAADIKETSSATVPGEMIVELDDEMAGRLEGLSAGEAGALLGVNTASRLFKDGGEWEPRHRKAGLHRWYKLTFDAETKSLTKASDDLMSIPGVISTEPVRKIKSNATPIFNDPGLGQQWHYYNDGTLTSNHKSGCDINVLPVWENFTAGSKNVIVAVIDGGVDMTHEDLSAVTIKGGAKGSKNFVKGQEGFTITAHSHGTHVAGTIGAINNNGKGVSGIAGGSDGNGGVSILSCQIFAVNPDDPTKDLGGDSYNAMVWAADNGAVICNNSWGYVYDTEEDAANGSVGSMSAAINYFINNAGTDGNGNQTGPMKGGVVIFAAGNEGWAHGWPAEYEPVIAVGSVGPNFTRAYYSNYGDWVDIAAPGGDANYDKGQVYSTLPNNAYGSFQGTSMACPHVSGVAALIVSHFGGPGFTNEMLKTRLLASAKTNVISKNAKIGPLVDAYGAFTYGGTTPPDAVSSFTASAKSNFVTFNWKVTKDNDDKKAYGYVLLASTNASDFTSIDVNNLPSTVKTLNVEVGSLTVGAAISGTMSGLDFETKYYTAIVGYDYWKNYSSASPVVEVTTGANTAPTVTTSYEGDYDIRAHAVVNIDYTIADPDGHSFTVQFTPGSDAAKSSLIADGSYRLTLTGKDDEPGDYTAKYTVKDAFGATTEFKIDYTLLENQAPVVRSSISNLYYEAIGQKLAINMDNYIYDPDEEQLSYSITTNPTGIVHLNQVSNTINLTTLAYGLTSVTITGKDAKGLSASVSFQVNVRDPKADPDVYPSKVTDYLYISDGGEKTISITITNNGGAVLYEKTVSASAFNPAAVDMRSYAPGVYGVKIESDGKSVKRTIVKL